MKMIKRCGCFLCFCFILIMVRNIECFAQPLEDTIVRVGYVELQGFLYQDQDGSYKGLAYELLEEIAIYNNWEYEFLECGYSESKELLETGKIDIFVPYQKTAKRQEDYEYSTNVFCTNRASLLVLPESQIHYNEFEKLDQIIIGTAKGTRNGERFKEYLNEHGCQITLKEDYRTQSELIQAAKNGDIDAFVSASNRGITDCRIVSVLSETNSYVIAKKENRIYLDLIDDALEKIGLEMPNLIENLNEKYQISNEGSYPSLTAEEMEYIQEKKKVTVEIAAQECDSKGDFSGSAKVIFDNIERLTGLEFVPVIGQNATSILDDISKGSADIIYAFNHDYDWAKKHNIWLSRTYAEFYNKIITKTNKNEIHTVSVVPETYIAYYIEKNTNYEMVSFSSYEECINAVLSEKVDATFCNSPIGNYYSTYPKYNTLSFLTAYDFMSSYSMGVSRNSDQILIDILNKAFLCISESTLNSAYEVQMNSRGISIIDIFYSHPRTVILLIVIAVIVLSSLIYIILYMINMKKKNDQLSVAVHAKTDFMARMSHDMRTPMNGILGLTQLTRDETNPVVIQKNLDQIELSGKVLLDLINDTLDMNKIESGNLELHLGMINSEDVFGNVISNATIMAKAKGVELKINYPSIAHDKWVPVIADASRLEQILLNVISNAIKFTPEGNTVELIMETLSVDDEIVRDKYIIRDTGIGMSTEFLPHIFEPFSQENRSAGSKDQGTGLGMPIVKQLVTLMGGDIQIKSELNKGTEVTLLMQYPIYKGSVEKKITYEMIDKSILNGRHVLLCEDHPINAQITMKMLEKKGIVVEWAENGKIGVEKFEKSQEGFYDIILEDIRMPVMDGLESTRAIRSLKRKDASTIPIIAMTANAFHEDIENCLAAGMNAHLAKPVDANDLYETVARFCVRKETENVGKKNNC